jgi:hypothetical protein
MWHILYFYIIFVLYLYYILLILDMFYDIMTPEILMTVLWYTEILNVSPE